MNDHERAMRSASLALDFPLSSVDRDSLDRHLADCASCRVVTDGLATDARSLRAIASTAPRPDLRAAFAGAVDRPDHVRAVLVGDLRPSLRLVALVALIALIGAGIAAGALVGSRALDPLRSSARPSAGPSIGVEAAVVEQTLTGCRADWIAPFRGTVLAICSGNLTYLGPGASARVLGSGIGAVALTSKTIWAVERDALIGLSATAETVTGRVADAGGDLVAADDHDVWVERTGARTVLRVDAPNGRIVATIGVGSNPEGILIALGRVWVTNRGSNTVSEIDPATNTITDVIPVGAGPLGIVAAGGAIWVANDGSGTVTRIDPATHSVITVDIDPARNSEVIPAIAARADGSIWVIDAHAQQVVSVSGSGLISRRLTVPGLSDISVLAADGSSLWVGDSSGTLSEIRAP